jgi:hypothetical protein
MLLIAFGYQLHERQSYAGRCSPWRSVARLLEEVVPDLLAPRPRRRNIRPGAHGRAAVRDPSSRYQLDRIFELIHAAQYSFHDLSWMSLDRKAPRTPRLNMAFELGLAIALSRAPNARHQWFVFDTISHRLDKALSDLGGIRPRIHDMSPQSILRCLMNALGRQKSSADAREPDRHLCCRREDGAALQGTTSWYITTNYCSAAPPNLRSVEPRLLACVRRIIGMPSLNNNRVLLVGCDALILLDDGFVR